MRGKRERVKHEDFKDKRQDEIRATKREVQGGCNQDQEHKPSKTGRGPGDKTKIYFERYTITKLHRLRCQETLRERESCCCMSRQSRNCCSINICGNETRIIKLTDNSHFPIDNLISCKVVLRDRSRYHALKRRSFLITEALTEM